MKMTVDFHLLIDTMSVMKELALTGSLITNDLDTIL